MRAWPAEPELLSEALSERHLCSLGPEDLCTFNSSDPNPLVPAASQALRPSKGSAAQALEALQGWIESLGRRTGCSDHKAVDSGEPVIP